MPTERKNIQLIYYSVLCIHASTCDNGFLFSVGSFCINRYMGCALQETFLECIYSTVAPLPINEQVLANSPQLHGSNGNRITVAQVAHNCFVFYIVFSSWIAKSILQKLERVAPTFAASSGGFWSRQILSDFSETKVNINQTDTTDIFSHWHMQYVTIISV